MTFVELFLIAIGLSMDAFAVSVGKGLAMRRIDLRQAGLLALFFGGFQALMPAIGWALGAQFASHVAAYAHWIAFALLAFIGAKMLVEAIREDGGSGGAKESADAEGLGDAKSPGGEGGDERAGGSGAEEGGDAHVGVRTGEALAQPVADTVHVAPAVTVGELFVLAVATSIDALAAGVSFSFLDVNIVFAVGLIGVTTFSLSLVGVVVGNRLGSRWEKPSAILGGVILIVIGLKILLEGLGILP